MRTYVLDANAKMPLYEQLYRALKEDILTGAIAGGEKLPSKRTLAEHLNISRITVENAYNQLVTEGYLTSRPKSGYYAETLEALPQRLPPVRELPVAVQVPPPTVSAGQFPFSIWARLMRSVLLDQHDLLLQPPPNTGLPELRQAITGMLRRSRGMEVSPENIVIGAGAEYLYNILIQLLGKDLRYGLENPGHRKIRQVYEANGVEICPISLDESGVSFASLLFSHANVLHFSPGHQYPTGVVMPIVRRRQLMNWVGGREDQWLIEDDYDSEFRFSGRLVPTMYSMDTLGRVIYLNTFSRTITPALRISYMILPDALMARYRQRLGFYSCTVPSMEQLTLARFLEEGHFEKHVSRMKRHYRILRDQLLKLLRQSCKADRMTVQGDEAGLHFLLRLDTALSDDVIEQRLAEGGIRAACLRHYAVGLPDEAVRGRVVIQYSELAEADLPRVVELLEGLVRE